MTSERKIRIGGASGFWGDSDIATPQLLASGKVDYLVYDYLAEITMSILARARAKDPAAGYAADFVRVVAENISAIGEKKVRVLSNAGGVNPEKCAQEIRSEVERAGLELKIAVVIGDDLMPIADSLREQGLSEIRTGDALPAGLWSMNAYLGAGAIAKALGNGADIVITGRCVDSALTLAICMHEFGWSETDHDRLAAGSLAGHILECGAQASGGIHTDWQETGNWANIGYPIVEVRASGEFLVTKPEGTGGLVSRGTVAEQMVYEIGDPRRYILPDVTCDFAEVTVEEIAPDIVLVKGARGAPPPPEYKVSATYQDGYRVGMYLTVGGIDAVPKAAKVADAVLERCSAKFSAKGVPPFSRVNVEILGSEASYGPHGRAKHAREVVLKIAAAHQNQTELKTLVQELTSSGTSMAPGIGGMGGNRPKISPVVRLFSCLIPKDKVAIRVEMDGKQISYIVPAPSVGTQPARPHMEQGGQPDRRTDAEVQLIDLAFGRSGDKGNDANIGIIARRPEFLPYIRDQLTDVKVAAWFAHLGPARVDRFDLPGVDGLNFLLFDVLDGGGIASLRNDPQGKAYAQMLLEFPIYIDRELLPLISKRKEIQPRTKSIGS